MPEDLRAARDRAGSLRYHEEVARTAYTRASARWGDHDLVVLVGDLDDCQGRGLVESLTGPGPVSKHRRETAGEGRPFMTVALPREMAVEKLSPVSARAEEVLSQPARPGFFWIVAVSRGGALYSQLEVAQEAGQDAV